MKFCDLMDHLFGIGPVEPPKPTPPPKPPEVVRPFVAKLAAMILEGDCSCDGFGFERQWSFALETNLRATARQVFHDYGWGYEPLDYRVRLGGHEQQLNEAEASAMHSAIRTVEAARDKIASAKRAEETAKIIARIERYKIKERDAK